MLGRDFVVRSQEENLKYLGMGEDLAPTEINDYAASCADLVIYRNKWNAELETCSVLIFEDRSGLVTELENDVGDQPILECFRNMYGTVANLVVQAAQNSIVIDNVYIFGIVRANLCIWCKCPAEDHHITGTWLMEDTEKGARTIEEIQILARTKKGVLRHMAVLGNQYLVATIKTITQFNMSYTLFESV